MAEKMVVAYATIQETGERILVVDQENRPVCVTLGTALKMKLDGFPFKFADIREMFDVIEIEIN